MVNLPKIGVLTFHKCINYGSYWQARCLVEGLRAHGYEAELIDHHCPEVTRAEWRSALQPRLPGRSDRREIRAYAGKVRKFRDAILSLPLSAPVPLHEPGSIVGYDLVLVGSDEVWNLAHPWYGNAPIFYGAGLPVSRLVSYAGSFGSYSCHWGLDEFWARQLKRFDGLSVRDENSYWLVRGATGREAELVLDPCLQFPPTVAAAGGADREPYALVYGHSFPLWLVESVKRWAASAGVRLVSIGYRNDFADEQLLASGPLEFAELMAGAQSVITNFFHGCIFALLNAKPFVTAPGEYRQNKICDLMAALDADCRLVSETNSQRDYEQLLSMPPGAPTVERIGELRQISEGFLHAALA